MDTPFEIEGIENIQRAIWAIYYHIISGPSEETIDIQHSYCPDGPDTWCKYKLDVINGTDVYSTNRKCLPPVFRDELLPIFCRLSSSELLKSFAKGLTQNQNESLNNVVWSKCSKRIAQQCCMEQMLKTNRSTMLYGANAQNESLNNVVWSKCSKRIFIGLHRFKLAVSEAMTAFNDGAKSREDLLSKLNLECGVSAKKVLSVQSKIRLRNAKIKSTEKCRKRRQALRQMRKGKKKP